MPVNLTTPLPKLTKQNFFGRVKQTFLRLMKWYISRQWTDLRVGGGAPVKGRLSCRNSVGLKDSRSSLVSGSSTTCTSQEHVATMNWVSSAIVDGSSTAHLSVKYLRQQKRIKREIPRRAVQNNIELSHQVNKIGMALSGCVLAEIKVEMINL